MRMLCAHGRIASVDGPNVILHTNGIKCDAPEDKDLKAQTVTLGALTFTADQIFRHAHLPVKRTVGSGSLTAMGRTMPAPGAVTFKVR